jgi:hypothetical protein
VVALTYRATVDETGAAGETPRVRVADLAELILFKHVALHDLLVHLPWRVSALEQHGGRGP